MEKRRRISAAAGGQVEDRISALPDEILHQILTLLKPPNRPAKVSVLSKRWNQVWSSYPILELDGPTPCCMKLFQRRINSNFPTESIAIRTCLLSCSWPPNLLDELLDLIARVSPRELDFYFDTCRRYRIPKRFFLENNDRFVRRLRVLKLRWCDFDDYFGEENPFAGLGSSLEVLRLEEVSFPNGRLMNSMISAAAALSALEIVRNRNGLLNGKIQVPDSQDADFGRRIDFEIHSVRSLKSLHLCGVTCGVGLNSMIAGAALLEDLTLEAVTGVPRFQIRNHPSLKSVRVGYLTGLGFEITGTRSLEVLRVSQFDMADFEVSSVPNLKQVHIESVWKITQRQLGDLISNFPSFESINLNNLFGIPQLRIVNVGHNHQEAELVWPDYATLKIDAPDFVHQDNFRDLLLKLYRTTSGTGSISLFYPESVSCSFEHLKRILVELSQFRPAVVFYRRVGKQVSWNRVLITPVVESLRFPSCFLNEGRDDFLDYVFWTCHPKSIHFDGKGNRVPKKEFMLALEYICKRFTERGTCTRCEFGCKCWRGLLKDVKLVTKVRKEGVEEEKQVKISKETMSSLAGGARVSFILTWR